MKEFADELRTRREARRLSQMDISSATKIQLKYIRAMEGGNFSFLPQPYVRAFLRDYAKAIEIDADETLRRYDACLEEARGRGKTPPVEEALPRAVRETEEPVVARRTGFLRSLCLSFLNLIKSGASGQKVLPLAAVVVIVGVVLLVANLTKNSGKESLQETPFDQVMRERERSGAGVADSASERHAPSVGFVHSSDSLLLEAKTTEQVWVRLLVDEGMPKEYLFAPGATASWRAKEKFRVSLGNAGGISFTLNGRNLGTLGKPGGVIRSVLISREGVQR